MAENDFEIVTLQDTFYRDGFNKILLIIVGFFLAIFALVALGLYLHLSKPQPVTFQVGKEWRIVAPVALDQPYLSNADLLQWISDVLPQAFTLDFIYYNDQLQSKSNLFTQAGWKVFLNQLNIYVNHNMMQTNKVFATGGAASAPTIINQGLLSGKYAWWVQMTVDVFYSGYNPPENKELNLQILVVRVPTLNNLNGVGIENIIVTNTSSVL